jgi:hypothetical protein
MSVFENWLKKNAANGTDKCALLPMKTSKASESRFARAIHWASSLKFITRLC